MHQLFSEELFIKRHSFPFDISSYMLESAIVDHSAIFVDAIRLRDHFGEVEDPPPRLRGWE